MERIRGHTIAVASMAKMTPRELRNAAVNDESQMTFHEWPSMPIFQFGQPEEVGAVMPTPEIHDRGGEATAVFVMFCILVCSAVCCEAFGMNAQPRGFKIHSTGLNAAQPVGK